MGKVIEFQRQQQIESTDDLANYRELGILETFTIQGDSDEDCEMQFLSIMADAKPGDVLYVTEPGINKELASTSRKSPTTSSTSLPEGSSKDLSTESTPLTSEPLS
jgi:hypothetical protein